MRLTPRPLEIGKTDGFTEHNDIFGYRDYGERLANLICSASDETLTLALDAPWGSGKTVFCQQWAGLMRQRGMPVIYFDAFEHDYHEDPLIAVLSHLLSFAEQHSESDNFDIIKEKAKQLGKAFGPIAARIGTRALTAGLMSSDDIKDLGDVYKSLIEGAAEELGKGVTEALTQRLVQSATSTASYAHLHQTLAELIVPMFETAANGIAEDMLEKRSQSPRLIFIVDELDRCRPDFAILLLETIKHIFSCEGIYFVLSVYKEHLDECYAHKFGTDGKGAIGLEKFLRYRAVLPGDNNAHHTPDHTREAKYLRYLLESYEFHPSDSQWTDNVFGDLLGIALKHQCSLRTIQIIVANVVLAANCSTDSKFRSPHLIAGLCAMKHLNQQLYDSARQGTLQVGEAIGFLQIDDNNRDWLVPEWEAAIGGDSLSDRAQEARRYMRTRFHIRDGSLLPFLSTLIDSFDFVEKPNPPTES